MGSAPPTTPDKLLRLAVLIFQMRWAGGGDVLKAAE